MVFSCYNNPIWIHHSMDNEDEWIMRVVINVGKRSILCVSSDGDEKIVECDEPQEFINVVEFCKTVLEPEDIFYEEIKVARV